MKKAPKMFRSLFTKLINKKAGQRILTGAGAVVVFITIYCLILPAVAIDKESAEEAPGMYLEESVVQDEIAAETDTDAGETDAEPAVAVADGSVMMLSSEIGTEQSVSNGDDLQEQEENDVTGAEDAAAQVDVPADETDAYVDGASGWNETVTDPVYDGGSIEEAAEVPEEELSEDTAFAADTEDSGIAYEEGDDWYDADAEGTAGLSGEDAAETVEIEDTNDTAETAEDAGTVEYEPVTESDTTDDITENAEETYMAEDSEETAEPEEYSAPEEDVVPGETAESEEGAEETPEFEPEAAVTLSAFCNDVMITAEFDENAVIPEGTSLAVREFSPLVEEEKDILESYKNMADQAVVQQNADWLTDGARLFELTLEDAEGNVFGADGTVTLHIAFSEAAPVHCAEMAAAQFITDENDTVQAVALSANVLRDADGDVTDCTVETEGLTPVCFVWRDADLYYNSDEDTESNTDIDTDAETETEAADPETAIAEEGEAADGEPDEEVNPGEVSGSVGTYAAGEADGTEEDGAEAGDAEAGKAGAADAAVDAETDEAGNVEEEADGVENEDAEAVDAEDDDAKSEDIEADDAKSDGEESDQSETDRNEEDREQKAVYPAQSFSDHTDSVRVQVFAGEGAFPAGTTMTVKDVEDQETIDTITDFVEKEVSRVHAVDITFYDIDGNEIEPLKEIRVIMSAEESEDSEAIQVVHVDNDGVAEAVEDVKVFEGSGEARAQIVEQGQEPEDGGSALAEVEEEETDEADDGRSVPAEAEEDETDEAEEDENDAAAESGIGSLEDSDDDVSAENETGSVDESEDSVEEETTEDEDRANTDAADLSEVIPEESVEFEAAEFSVYAFVYTVDFHYEVNGKMYEFSIPGGGFASFYKIVEVLGIARIDENTAVSGENQVNEGENEPENDIYNGVEETGVEAINANGSNYEESISLNNVEVSEATKKFVADVASVEFSSPELVWVGKVDEATTVGGLKEANGLEIQYSTELTGEQIEKINSSTVEGGDWALISMLPFASVETLTITMKNGDQWTVKVTDAPGDTAGNRAASDMVTVTVDKLWKNAAGETATENIPETVTFNLWRQRQVIPPSTVIIQKQTSESGTVQVLGSYALEPGSSATVRYVYDGNFAGQYGHSGAGEAGYTIGGAFTSVRGNPAGTFSVTAGTAENPTMVVFNDYVWGGGKLISVSASGTELINEIEEDTNFSDQIELRNSSWSGSFNAYPAQDDNYQYTYYVTENQVEGWLTTYENNSGLSSSGTVTVSNIESKHITVSKKWVDSTGATAEWPTDKTVEVRLQRRVGFNDWEDVAGASWTLDSDTQSYEFIVNPLDQYDQVYDYRAVEAGVEGYVPTVAEDANGNFTITNAPVETLDNVRVTKEWKDASDWSAEFVLQWAPVYPGHNAPSVDFVNWEPEQRVTLTNENPTNTTTFNDLPKYGVDAHGDVFRYQYSLDEVSYSATVDGESISYDGSEYVGDKYIPVYTHDAGELSDSNEDYYISVSNTESLEVGGESIIVPFSKTWSNSEIMNDSDAYATFKISRYVRQAYRDTSHLSDRDLIADPVTVTLQDEDGRTVDTISVQPNMGVYVYMVASPSINTSTAISVTGGGLTGQNFSNNGSNHQALTWTTPFIYPTHNVTLTISGDTERVAAQLLDTTPGTAAVKDENYNETFTLNHDNGWNTELELPVEVLGAVSGRTQTVYHYEYYFEEDENSAGSLANPANPYYAHFTPNYNETHRVSTNTSVNVVNNQVKPFYVKKEWHDSKDPNGWPEIRFTLYQGFAGSNGHVQTGHVFVEPNGERYENIPLNSDNDWTWQCPISLPTEVDGQPVGYYVVENTKNTENNRVSVIYQNSTFYSDGTVHTYGDEITNSTVHDHRIWIYDYYNDQNQYHAKRTDQNAPQGQDGGFVGNEGTLFISNRAPEYMQFDVKKKWLELQSDGGLATTTSYQHRMTSTYLKIEILRKTVPINGTINDTIVDWEEYGQPFYIGYNENRQPDISDPNNYYLPYQGDWHWQANDTGNDQGLPLTGFYREADGTYTPVKYFYITRELGVFSDKYGTPLEDNGYCWYVELLPQAWGIDRPEVFPRITAQDQDRLVNTQATDLLVEKIWDDTPKNVAEVYVKIWRTEGANGTPHDFTADIASKTNTLQDYGFVDDPSRLQMLDGGVLVLGLTPEEGSVMITGVPMLAEGKNITKDGDVYHYWIEEVGYKDNNGQVFLNAGNNSAVSQFFPRYTRWQPAEGEEGGGHWVEEWTYNPTDNKIRLYSMGNNKLRVGNTPTIDISVKKEWYDDEGNKLEDSFRQIDSVNIKVRRIAQKFVNGQPVGAVQREFLTFDNSDTVQIKKSGARYVVTASETGSTQYSITQDTTTSVGSWTTILDGLQEMAFLGSEEWRYGYEIIEATQGDWKVTVTGNPVTSGSATVVIENHDKPKTVDLSITKELDGTSIPGSARLKLFTVTVDFSGTEDMAGPAHGNGTYTLVWDPEQPATGRPELRPETIKVTRKEGTEPYQNQYNPVNLKLLPGETVTIKELPNKVSYVVSEPSASMPAGYSLKQAGVNVECEQTPQHQGSSSVSDDNVVTVQRAISDGEVVFVNELGYGALKISKIVTINGAPPKQPQYPEVDDTYVFSVVGPTSAGESGRVTKYVQITVTNGVMTSYKVADSNTTEAWNNATEVTESTGAIVSDLPEGDYVVTELPVEGMYVSLITGGKMTEESGREYNDADTTARTVTVHVTAGDTTAVKSGASTEYTNNKSFVDIKIIKIDENTRSSTPQTKLPAAEFQLYKYTVSQGSSTGNYTVYPDETGSKKVTISEAGDDYGTLAFASLPDGQYKISETKSPDGYILTQNNDVYFDIVHGVATRYAGEYSGTARAASAASGNDVVIGETTEIALITYAKATDTDPATFIVGNTPGSALPNTGGPGTKLFTILGLILMLLAGVLLISKRRFIF